MKKALPFLLYPMLGLLAGWASVRVGSSGPNEPTEPESIRRVREEREASPPWTGEDFFQAALKRTGAGFNPTSELLGDWTDAEIRAALDEALTDPETLIQNGGIAATLLREYVRRDLDAALEWFSAIPTIHQANLAAALSHAWPEDRAMDG